MRIAIIGAGFTGLAAAYKLAEDNEVYLFEKNKYPGGLAIGYREKEWKWTLEEHYHHWFTNDKSILELAKKINYPVLIRRPKTSVYVDSEIFQLDSVKNVIEFPKLGFIDKVRMGSLLAFLKLNPYWSPLERYNSSKVLPKIMGEKAYKTLWEPQLNNKFNDYKNDVSLAWFWARVYKRSPSLAYPEGGFLTFAEKIIEELEKMGVKTLLNSGVKKITSNAKIKIEVENNPSINKIEFDRVIITSPSFLLPKILPQLPDNYVKKMNKLKSLGAINLVVRMKKPFFSDKTYWLSVCDNESPVTAIVEHTNFMDKKNYNNENLLYLGKYLSNDHRYFNMSAEEVLKEYDPFLRKINKDYKKNLINVKKFQANYAQPIIPVNYSKIIPDHRLPIKNIYLANIDQVYPWDRGTNYAVELGEKVADIVSNA